MLACRLPSQPGQAMLKLQASMLSQLRCAAGSSKDRAGGGGWHQHQSAAYQAEGRRGERADHREGVPHPSLKCDAVLKAEQDQEPDRVQVSVTFCWLAAAALLLMLECSRSNRLILLRVSFVSPHAVICSKAA